MVNDLALRCAQVERRSLPLLPPPDTAGAASSLQEAVRQAAQRADEAGDDLNTVYAGIEDAYAALDALYSHLRGVRSRSHPSALPESNASPSAVSFG